MGEDLLTERVVLAEAEQKLNMSRLLRQTGEVADFLDSVRTLELSLIARLLQARRRAEEIKRSETRLKPLISLFVGGTAALVDAAEELGDTTNQAFDTGDAAQAFLRSRGILARDAAGLEQMSQLAVTEEFLVAGRIRLGTLLDLVATFLDTLDVMFDLYQDEPAVEAAGAAAAGRRAGGDRGRGDGELGACHRASMPGIQLSASSGVCGAMDPGDEHRDDTLLRRCGERAAGAARGADAQAAVAEREEAAERHDEAADPDQAHQRIEIGAHHPAAAVLQRIAQHDVEIAGPGGVDAGLGGGLARRVIDALGRVQFGDRRSLRASRRTGRPAPGSWGPGSARRRGRSARSRQSRCASPTFRVTTCSLCQAVVATMPSTIRPMPACASVVP